MTVLFQSGSFTTAATASVGIKSPQSNEYHVENEQDHLCSVNPLYLICTNEEERTYAHSSIVRKQFEVKSCLDVDDYEVFVSSVQGVDIIEPPTYKHNSNGFSTIELAFRVLDSCEIGNICFKLRPSVQTDDDTTSQVCFEQNVYCYHDSDYDYVSTVYLDCLADCSENLQSYLLDIDRQGELIEEVEQEPILVRAADGSTRYSHEVAGYISWSDDASGVHAADGVKVELYAINGSTETLVGSTYTVSSGGYSIAFSSSITSQPVKFKVASEGTNITVRQASSPYSIYKYESSTFSVSTFTKASYTANNTTNIGQSISIQQAMAMANKYIYSLDSSYLSNINVYYPNSYSNSYFSPSSVAIYIKQGHQYEWDTLQHEYGHYVQHHYSIANSPGGTHYLSANLADSLNDKSAGIRLAWGEGWATYFAINLQKEMSASIYYIPHVGDTHYQDSSNSIDLDIEYLPTNYRKGEANESTVCAVLYDMTDGYNSAEDDNVYFANNNIWDITKSNNCTTLSEFITAFYAAGFPYSTRLALGSTLTRYKVAASPYTPTGTNPPTFSWLPQGGSTLFPNNSFKVVFLNSNYNVITYTSYTSSNSIQLTSYQWTQIQNASTPVYYYIETNQTEQNVETGPYYSTLMTL